MWFQNSDASAASTMAVKNGRLGVDHDSAIGEMRGK